MVRRLDEARRIVTSDRQLFSTYYKGLETGLEAPDHDSWDGWRRLADETLFPAYRDQIRFAALSLDGVGALSYGEFSLTLRDEMIAHRASLFERNSAQLLAELNYTLPPGYRAVWEDRAKLGIAKLAARVNPGTTEADFSQLVLRQGKTSGEEDFVEVHVWGPLSIRSVGRIWYTPGKRRVLKPLLQDLQKKLSPFGLNVETAE